MTTLPPETPRQMLFAQLRKLGYVAVLCICVLVLWLLAGIYTTEFVAEHSLLENIQLAVMLLTSISFGIQATLNKIHRPTLLLLTALAAAACVRELDAYFDAILPIISWKFCWAFPIAALIYNLRHLPEARESMISFLRSNSFNMLVTAAIIIVPMAQLLGHRSFLSDMIENPEVDTYLLRRILEEPIELMGYLQILLASLEFYIEAQLRKTH